MTEPQELTYISIYDGPGGIMLATQEIKYSIANQWTLYRYDLTSTIAPGQDIQIVFQRTPEFDSGNTHSGIALDDVSLIACTQGVASGPPAIPLIRNGHRSVSAGDWDNDGDLDFAIGNSRVLFGTELINASNQVIAYNEDRYEVAWESLEKYDTREVAWGDWDSDGDLDLAVANYNDMTQVYEYDAGTLHLSPANGLGWQSEETSASWSVAWGDWDNDGDLDLAVGNYAEKNQVYENENDRLSLVWQSPDAATTTSLAWGDWDNDNDLDLAIGNYGQNNVIYENTGGQLELDFGNEVGWVFAEIDQTRSLGWGDWDRDGDFDLAVGNELQPNLVHENVGKAFTLDPSNGLGWQSAVPESTTKIAWGDWNGDGYLELAVANFARSNQIYLNISGTLGTSIPFPEQSQTTDVIWADVNNDLDVDLYFTNWLQQDKIESIGFPVTYQVLPDSGLGWISSETDMSKTSSVTWGDWDNDGDLDLAAGNANERNYVYENNEGTLELDPNVGYGWQSDVEENTLSVAWGDWDGDGDLDLAVGNSGQQNKVYENRDNTLRLQWQSQEISSTTSLAWGDWDGDSDLDLAIGNANQRNQVYANISGSLMFDPANGIGWESPYISDTRSVAWGDWDNDGDLDLAVGNFAQPNQIYEFQDGTLNLSLESHIGWQSADSANTQSLAWGDWTGDGILDLAVGNFGAANQVFIGSTETMSQTGAFGQARPIDKTTSVIWVDINGDGDLDLVTANHLDGTQNL
ncbi:VCBS repeat-containing protein [Chloroflexi bacterium TSY]|nr:VCBS repeat-containing protein [Chloroflexi bacterium TSY]